MNSLELVNKLYKPYRITKLSKCTLIDSTEGRFIIKEKSKKDIKGLFYYLKSRNFDNIPKLIDDTRSDINIYEYIEEIEYPKDQKAYDMIKLITKLHSQTSYKREVREDKYKEIYDNISSNLNYYRDKYTKYVDKIEDETFMSPSEYLFIRNSSKLFNQIDFCTDKLNEWYEMVKDKREIRVCLIHNKLSLDHYIRGDKEVLISWEDSSIDSPVLDIYKFYEKEALNIEFSSLLNYYIKYMGLEDDEKYLLLLLICLPKNIELKENTEIKKCQKLGEYLDYICKSEKLARPYYSIDNEEQ